MDSKIEELLAPIADLIIATEHFCGCIMGKFHTTRPISIKEIERLCQQAQESIVAIGNLKVSTDVVPPPQSASTRQVFPYKQESGLSGHLDVPDEEVGERK